MDSHMEIVPNVGYGSHTITISDDQLEIIYTELQEKVAELQISRDAIGGTYNVLRINKIKTSQIVGYGQHSNGPPPSNNDTSIAAIVKRVSAIEHVPRYQLIPTGSSKIDITIRDDDLADNMIKIKEILKLCS